MASDKQTAVYFTLKFKVFQLITHEQLMSFWELLDSPDEKDHEMVYAFIRENWDQYQIEQEKSNQEAVEKYQALVRARNSYEDKQKLKT